MDELTNLLREKYSMDPETARSVATFMMQHRGGRDVYQAQDAFDAGVTGGPDEKKATREKKLALDAQAKPTAASLPRSSGDHPMVQKIMDLTGMSDQDAVDAADMLNHTDLDSMFKSKVAMDRLNQGVDAYGRPVQDVSPFSGLDKAREDAEAMDAMEHRGATAPLTQEQHAAAMQDWQDPYRQYFERTGQPYVDDSRVEVKRPFDAITTRPGATSLPNTNYYDVIDHGQHIARVPLDGKVAQAQARAHHAQKLSGVKMLSDYIQAQDIQNANELQKGALWQMTLPPRVQ